MPNLFTLHAKKIFCHRESVKKILLIGRFKYFHCYCQRHEARAAAWEKVFFGLWLNLFLCAAVFLTLSSAESITYLHCIVHITWLYILTALSFHWALLTIYSPIAFDMLIKHKSLCMGATVRLRERESYNNQRCMNMCFALSLYFRMSVHFCHDHCLLYTLDISQLAIECRKNRHTQTYSQCMRTILWTLLTQSIFWP